MTAQSLFNIYTMKLFETMRRTPELSAGTPLTSIILSGICRHVRPQETPCPKKETRGRKPKRNGPDIYAAIGKRISAWRKKRVRNWENFSRDDLAIETGTPKYLLQNYFQIYLGKDFREWKTEVKVDAAKYLLVKYPGRHVNEIGTMAGFGDNANFHRQFRRISGMTPVRWREENC